jgi:aryl-alcohol dehydrogenase-like predicted oxidoreductase
MDDTTDQQPAPRERIGPRARVRTVGLIAGGLLAGGILTGTMTANAATDTGTTTTPSVTQEESATTDDGSTAAPEDCPEGAGPDSGSTAPSTGEESAPAEPSA